MSETFCPHCGGLHYPGAGSCPQSPSTGRILPDGLRVLKRLGKTGLGELYLAENVDSHVQVELVIVGLETKGRQPDADVAGLVELRDQLHRAARLQHPNVASVSAMGETKDGALWATSEVLQGELLSEIHERGGAILPSSTVIDLVLQAASGLQAAHQVGLFHGNLSPDTILVTRTADNRPLVKLIRFGLLPLEAEPSVAGDESRKYVAAERLTGHPPDERSDVFSLGAVLQHLLTEVLASAQRDQALPNPEAITRVLAKALDPSPDNRFQSVAAFARALTTATSRPPGAIRSRTRRASRLGAVLAVTAVYAIAALWIVRSSTNRSRSGNAGNGAIAAGESITTGEVRESTSDALDSTLRLLLEARTDSATDRPRTSPVRRGSENSERPVESARSPAASSPRADHGAPSASTLVDVRSVDSTIQVDLRYATVNNFTGAPLPGYDAMRALLLREAASALARVQARLRSKGLGLRVFDAYRPVRASRAMVDWAERVGRRALLESGYISPRSRHNLGTSVDLTMIDLVTGAEIPMGTTFDNVADTAAQITIVSSEELRHRQMLAEAMESEGFSPYGPAWWHFNYPVKGAVPLDRVIR